MEPRACLADLSIQIQINWPRRSIDTATKDRRILAFEFQRLKGLNQIEQMPQRIVCVSGKCDPIIEFKLGELNV